MGSASSSGVITVKLRDPPSGSKSRSTKQNMDALEIDTSEPPPQQNEDATTATVDICRVCLLDNSGMRDIFQESVDASLSTKAMSFTNVKMLPGDGLPAQLCYVCADKLESAYEFKLQVEQADGVLRERFLGELSDSADYESATTILPGQLEDDKSLLKHDQLLLEQDEQPEEIQQRRCRTGPCPGDMVDEEPIQSPIHAIFPLQQSMCKAARYPGSAFFCALIFAIFPSIYLSK